MNFNWLNSPEGIKCMYTTLTMLWRFFHQRDTESTRLSWAEDCQTIWHQVILPLEVCFNCEEMLWSNCVCTWKVFVRNPKHQRHSVLARSYLRPPHCLPYTFPLKYPSWVWVSKKRSWIFSIILSLVDATLHTLEDVLQPSAKWVVDFARSGGGHE